MPLHLLDPARALNQFSSSPGRCSNFLLQLYAVTSSLYLLVPRYQKSVLLSPNFSQFRGLPKNKKEGAKNQTEAWLHKGGDGGPKKTQDSRTRRRSRAGVILFNRSGHVVMNEMDFFPVSDLFEWRIAIHSGYTHFSLLPELV